MLVLLRGKNSAVVVGYYPDVEDFGELDIGEPVVFRVEDFEAALLYMGLRRVVLQSGLISLSTWTLLEGASGIDG